MLQPGENNSGAHLSTLTGPPLTDCCWSDLPPAQERELSTLALDSIYEGPLIPFMHHSIGQPLAAAPDLFEAAGTERGVPSPGA